MRLLKINIYTVYLWLFAAAFAAFFLTGKSFFAGVSIVLTCVAPFYFILSWFSVSRWGKAVRASPERFWMAGLLFSAFLFLFFIVSRQWANSAINNVFSVDASLLPLTAQLITPLYVPFNFFFNDYVVLTLNTLNFFALFIITPLLALYQFFKGWKKRKKAFYRIICLFLIVFFVNFTGTIFHRVSLMKNELIVRVALWADFNDKDYCRNLWAEQPHKTLFLSADRVLTFYPANPPPLRLQIEQCTP